MKTQRFCRLHTWNWVACILSTKERRGPKKCSRSFMDISNHYTPQSAMQVLCCIHCYCRLGLGGRINGSKIFIIVPKLRPSSLQLSPSVRIGITGQVESQLSHKSHMLQGPEFRGDWRPRTLDTQLSVIRFMHINIITDWPEAWPTEKSWLLIRSFKAELRFTFKRIASFTI